MVDEATSRRSGIAGIVVAAVAVVFTIVFFGRFRPALQLVRQTVPPLAAAVVVIFACVAAGRGAIAVAARIMGGRRASRPAADLFLIGFAVFGTAVAIVATIGVAMDGVILLLTVVAAIAGAWIAGRECTLRPLSAPTFTSLLLAVPIVIAAVEAIAPVNSPDELVYKLAIPHAYQLWGRALQLPLASNSYLVLALQYTDLAALIASGGIAAKLVHFAAFLATIAVIRRMAGDLAAVIVSWTPALMIVSGWAWSEWGLLGLLLLSLDAYERAVEGAPENFAAAFLALGAAAAAKYTALPWLLAFAILLLVRHRDDSRLLLRGAIIVALFGSFFHVRNAVWTGSPFAPLFLPNAPHVANYRGGGLFGGWADLVRGFDIFDAPVSDESLGILLPAAFVAGLLALARQERRLRDLAIIGAVQMPILITVAPGSRNMINGVVPLALAGCIAVAGWMRTGAARLVLAIVAAAALAGQLTLVAFALQSYDFDSYLAGTQTPARYIEASRPFAAPYAWIARNTPANACVLLLGENRTFYLNRRFVAATNLDGPRMAAWLSSFRTADEFAAELRARGITHLVIHKPWYRVGNAPLGVLEQEYVLQVSPATHQMLVQTLATHCRQRYSDREYVVYEFVR